MGVFTLNYHETEGMHCTDCLAICYVLCSNPCDSLTNSSSPRDTVEYQVDARYSGYQAGLLTLLKTDNENWFPLKQWLDQSGFTYFHLLDNNPVGQINQLKPFENRVSRFMIGGNSPVHSTIWKISTGDLNIKKYRHRMTNHFVDQHQIVWVNSHWIEKQYGMTTNFREQALELEFVGTTTAPVREWHDYHAHWDKELSTKNSIQSRNFEATRLPKEEGKSIEISSWSGRYQINIEKSLINSSMQWDAVGHAGKVGLRVFGSAKASLETSTNLQHSESRTGLTKTQVQIEWPGLELEWMWTLKQQISLTVSPASLSSSWKITGCNSLMSRTIGFEVPNGLHARRWTPPDAMSEWSLNYGPSVAHLHTSRTLPATEDAPRLGDKKNPIPIYLLPGTNRIDYRFMNSWGGISNRHLIWNIPSIMIPQGHWNYHYEISAPLRVNGMLGYGLKPSLSLQAEATLQSTKDTIRTPAWVAKGSAIWTAGRTLYGQSVYALSYNHQQWQQHLHFNFSQGLQASLLYQKSRRLFPFPIDTTPRNLATDIRSNRDLFGFMPNGESLDLSGLWTVPRGYGLKMLRIEYPLKKLVQPKFRHKEYRAILQFEAWRQQWQWQLPQQSLSWQGRIQFKPSSLTMVYQAIAYQDGWQAFLQCHLRDGHHLGLSYALSRQSSLPIRSTTNLNAGNWTLEWKWIGLQSSRSARAQINPESSRVEYNGQFVLSHKNNTLPIISTNGLALIHLHFYGDQNANGIKDHDEIILDAAGGFEVPAGIPYQILTNGTALLGPFPNHSHIRMRLTPHHMRSPGWITDPTELELASMPNSTLKYQIGLLRSRQIIGTVEFAADSASLKENFLPQNRGGIRIHARLLNTEDQLDTGSMSLTPPSLPCERPYASSSELNSNHQTLTLSDGYFEFNDLMPGIYKVWADLSALHRPGYQSQCAPQVLDLRQQESHETILEL